MKRTFFLWAGLFLLIPFSATADFLSPFERLVDPTGVLKAAALSQAYSTGAQQFLMNGYLFIQSLFAKPLTLLTHSHNKDLWALFYLQGVFFVVLILTTRFLKHTLKGTPKDKTGMALLGLLFFISMVIGLLQISQQALAVFKQHALSGALLLMTFHLALQMLISIHYSVPFSLLRNTISLPKKGIPSHTLKYLIAIQKGTLYGFIPLLGALNLCLISPTFIDISRIFLAIYFLYITVHIGFSCYVLLTIKHKPLIWGVALSTLSGATFLFWFLPFYGTSLWAIDWAWGLNVFLIVQLYALLPFLKSLSNQLLLTYRKQNGFLVFLEQFISLEKGLRFFLTFMLALCFIKLMLLLNLHISRISIFEVFIDKLLLKTLSILIILWVAFLLQGHINRIIHNVVKTQKSRLDQKNQHQKFFALMSLITNFLPILLWVFAIYLILLQLDPKYFSYLAGLLGLLVVGIGFVGRSHIADILAGIVYTFQGLLGQGRYIKINGSLQGKIEEMRFQSISLREPSGALNTISYAQIKNITTYDHNFAPLSLALLKTAPLQECLDIIRNVCADFSKDNKMLTIQDVFFTEIDQKDATHISLKGFIQTQKLAAWETWSQVTPLIERALLEKGFIDEQG